MGILAILFWSTAFAFARDLSEQIGFLRSASLFSLLGGAIACAALLYRKDKRQELLSLPGKYFLACGGLFVLNNVSIYLAIGLSVTRQQVIEVGLINYLWPSLGLLLSVPIFGHRARPWLPAGIVLASAGVFLASVPPEGIDGAGFVSSLRMNGLAYILALVAAISWALYSNLTKKLGNTESSAAVSVFILATGLVLLSASFLFPEESHWSPRTILGLLYMALVPTVLGYLFWDMAMVRGNMILVLSLVYLNPLLVTLFSAVFLRVPVTLNLLIASILVIAGSVVCNKSVIQESTRRETTRTVDDR